MLKKPSDYFVKNEEKNNIPVVETDRSLHEELSKVESLSEQINQLQQELTQKVIRTDLEKLVLSQINTMQENFTILQEEFQQSNAKDISKFRESVSQLGDIVGNLVENEIPKYRKQIANTDIRISEKFDKFKNVVDENINDIREDVEIKVENIASAIDDNLEYFNQQLQETSSGVKKTVDTYNKLSKIVESRIEKENDQLEEYSKIIQSLHEAFVELETSLQQEISVSHQKAENKFETYKEEVDQIQNNLSISLDNRLENYQQELKNVKADVVISEQHIKNVKADVVIVEQHIKNVDKYLKENHQELIELKDEVFAEIEKLPLGDIEENVRKLERKLEYIEEVYNNIDPEVIVKEVIQEGLLNEPPSTDNKDSLTPLDQDFVTLDQLQQHYRLFINRIQQQLATLGGGGETQLKYLDDIVGIATNPSVYDGKFLTYNHSIKKFEFVTVTQGGGGGGGSGDYANVAGIATYASTAGISTYATSSGIATYASTSGVSTNVIGGIASVTSLNVSGVSTVGLLTAISIGIGTTNPTSTLQVQGTVSVSSTTTSAEFIGGGSDLRNLSGTHLVSYASASDISNSALSIAGINTYTQVGILTGSFATNASDFFGYSVATSADGKTVIVGARSDEVGATADTGVVYVFDRVGNSFNQVGILTGSFANNVADRFGVSLATSADGKTIVVGAETDELNIGNLTTGVVYVFDRIGNSFNQVGILTGSLAVDSFDFFGSSVATSADGKTIVVGAPDDEIDENNFTDAGVVYVYDRVGNSFNQVGILTGSATESGADFGTSVSISGDGKTIGVSDGWRSYIFERVGNTFNEVLLLNAIGQYNDKVLLDYQGKTIFISDSPNNTVYVFDRAGTSFNQVGILTGTYAVNPADQFGISLATSADGKTIVVGASTDEIGATTSTGVVYIFNRQGNTFNQVGILTGSFASQTSDVFGNAVSVSADGKTVIVGARNDEIGATTSTGVVYVFDQTRNTYVYSGPTGNIGIGITNPTSKLTVQGDVNISGVVTASSFSGNATSATSATSAGTATTATYLSDAANILTGTINKDRISTTNGLTVLGDLYVSNNISFGGTTTQLNTQQLQIVDADIVLGIGTSFSSTDNTANHGGIAIASTEGTPLVSLNIVPGETNPYTYKKFMWFKGDTIGAGLTDAWLANYAIGIGSTQVPNGVRLAAGNVKITENDLSVVRNINASGITTTGTLNVGVGGTIITTISNGNVGIGTTNPTSKLYVIPTSSGIAGIFSGTTSQDMVRITQTGTGNALVIEDSTNPDSSPFVINNSGSVGVGTTNPKTKFQIDGVISFINGNIRIGDSNTGTSSANFGNNIFIGAASGGSNITGVENIFLGEGSGYNNSSGGYNIFIGKDSGTNNITGDSNIFMGLLSGSLNDSGRNNIFIGENSGYNNIDGIENIFFGTTAGYSNTSGSNNQFIGQSSGQSNTIGSTNIFIGELAGSANQIGNSDIYLGSFSGLSTSASYKVILGSGGGYPYYFDSPDTTKNTQFAVGVRTDANPSKYWLVGNENFNVGIGTTNPTSKLYVGGNGYFTGIVTANTYYGKLRENITNISSNYSVQITDSVILATGTINVTMPSAVGLNGDKYYVKNVGVGTVTIKSSGVELIDDYTEMILSEKNSSITLISNNSKWLIF